MVGSSRPSHGIWTTMADRPRLSDRERMRLFRLHNRTCHICSLPIDGLTQRWDIEHVTTAMVHRSSR